LGGGGGATQKGGRKRGKLFSKKKRKKVRVNQGKEFETRGEISQRGVRMNLKVLFSGKREVRRFAGESGVQVTIGERGKRS